MAMRTRKLGKTGLEVGIIGLGTQYLVDVPRETVVSVVREAVDNGVNYFDVLFAPAHYRDNFGAAFDGLREKILIAGHLGVAETKGQYRKTRDVEESEALFEDLLSRLRTDYVDVAFICNCDEQDDYRQIVAPGGLLDLARRLRSQGKARFIGLSGHQVPVALEAARSGHFDVLMHSVNLTGDATAGRRQFYHVCASREIGLVVMKAFAGGALLEAGDHPALTPVQCLNYALSQPGVCTVVPGVKNCDQLRDALAYLHAGADERDFSAAAVHFRREVQGECVYCNHCLPCPVGIDVGKTIRLVVTASHADSVSQSLADEYAALPAKASECIECGTCTERCPFNVDVISKMTQAVETFEKT